MATTTARRRRFTAAQERLLVSIGGQMANLCHNLSQHPGEPLIERNALVMKQLYQEWDAIWNPPPREGRLIQVTPDEHNAMTVAACPESSLLAFGAALLAKKRPARKRSRKTVGA